MGGKSKIQRAIGAGASAGLFDEVVEVARFINISGSDRGFTIPNPANPLSDLHLDNISAPGVVADSSPVIFFRTRHTGTPTFSARLNNDRLVQHTPGSAGPQSWNEIIAPGVLLESGNQLTLAVGGAGSVTFSDITILYKSSQLTVRKPRVFAPIA